MQWLVGYHMDGTTRGSVHEPLSNYLYKNL